MGGLLQLPPSPRSASRANPVRTTYRKDASWCVTRVLRLYIDGFGAPGEIRTPDLLVRRAPWIFYALYFQQVRWPALTLRSAKYRRMVLGTVLHARHAPAQTHTRLAATLGGYDKTRLNSGHFPPVRVCDACARAKRLGETSPGLIPTSNTSRIYIIWRAIQSKAQSKASPTHLPVDLRALTGIFS